ncbi:MAG TPA: hypothetical protein PLA74_03895 [Syntrophales bacterium]|nr:hypothetical protein [Syntrophales bacterium]
MGYKGKVPLVKIVQFLIKNAVLSNEFGCISGVRAKQWLIGKPGFFVQFTFYPAHARHVPTFIIR